ncbi:hypothetical protein SLS58_006555 [Diplodia intermedia]|uniref:Protein kinase domain-containing protein n=1 Tax=Diplodia intermedia TaxID=856260 RepID=A0ABR3TMS6_9PEZI
MLPFAAKQARRLTTKTPSVPTEFVGVSGQRVGNQRYILKDIPESNFKYSQEMQDSLRECPNIRLFQDMVAEQPMFIYPYLSDDLLSLAREGLPLTTTKRILKDVLRGLDALHSQDIVHTDVKANNILINRREGSHGMAIDEVQLADIEDAAHVPPESTIVGLQAGNIMWRSPEAHMEAPLSKPSDIFSFGIVCIYAVLQRVIFAVGEEELAEGEEALAVVLERQTSYFGDEDGMNGLLEYLAASPWCEVLQILRQGFSKDNPRMPFSLWKGVDSDFKNLIGGLTNLDPRKRLSAHEALSHKWFADV